MDFQQALDEVLKETGYMQLKPKQQEAIEAFVSGKDVFVSLPTGYGKSVIYGILPSLFDKMNGCKGSIVVCVSPLTAIMVDQQQKFVAKGIKAEFVGEAQTDPAVVNRVLRGDLQLLYISPENLLNNKTYHSMLLSSTYTNTLVALAIDEAHCIKTWGEDFRTAFNHIGDLRSIVPPNVHIIALTATATPEVLRTVKHKLCLKDPVVIGLTPNRENIKYFIEPLPNIEILCELFGENLIHMRTGFPKTLVFFCTIAECVAAYKSLKAKLGKHFTDPPGYPDYHRFRLIDMYTRACSDEMRKKVLSSFMQPDGKLRLVVATMAFSMGVDCPDIVNVIHYGPPSSVLQYMQETGRAGRNNFPATALLLYSKPNKHAEQDIIQYANNTMNCRRQVILKNFLFYEADKVTLPKCRCCDICEKFCKCTICFKT